jgi:hypothetical protein
VDDSLPLLTAILERIIDGGLVVGLDRRVVYANPNLSRAAAIVRHHHERFDGRGYPDVLTGTAPRSGWCSRSSEARCSRVSSWAKPA